MIFEQHQVQVFKIVVDGRVDRSLPRSCESITKARVSDPNMNLRRAFALLLAPIRWGRTTYESVASVTPESHGICCIIWLTNACNVGTRCIENASRRHRVSTEFRQHTFFSGVSLRQIRARRTMKMKTMKMMFMRQIDRNRARTQRVIMRDMS